MSENRFSIRTAVVDDLEAITRIYGVAVRDGTASFETETPSLTVMQERFHGLVEAGFPYLVAEIDSRVVGYSYAGLYRTRYAYRNTVEDAIYIDQSAQGLGVGKALLGALIDLCERQGFRQMVAVVGDSRNSASINLHRSLGFHITGTLHSVGYKHGRWLDTVFMQRSLGMSDQEPPNRG